MFNIRHQIYFFNRFLLNSRSSNKTFFNNENKINFPKKFLVVKSSFEKKKYVLSQIEEEELKYLTEKSLIHACGHD